MRYPETRKPQLARRLLTLLLPLKLIFDWLEDRLNLRKGPS